MKNLELSKKELEAVVYQVFDSIATCGEEVNYRELTTGIKKLLKIAFPHYVDRSEFLQSFLNSYSITDDKRKDWNIFSKYIK